MKINIKKLDADAVLPTRGSSQAAGYDLYAKSSEDTVIPSHKTVMVGTGLAMEIPEGCDFCKKRSCLQAGTAPGKLCRSSGF